MTSLEIIRSVIIIAIVYTIFIAQAFTRRFDIILFSCDMVVVEIVSYENIYKYINAGISQVNVEGISQSVD